MDLDDDVDMRDAGPDSDPLEREELEVQWKSSQTSNRALDSLMLEAAQNAHAVGRARGWSTRSPSPRTAASTSRTVSAPTLSFNPHPPQPTPPASAANSTAPSSRRRARPTPRATSLSLSNGASVNTNLGATSTDPAQFLKILVGVSKQANQNAGIPVADKRKRQGVKQSSKLVTSKTGIKGKEREHRAPLSRTSSSVSISPSSVSSPGSNYSFLSPSTSGSADTSMTSPEREEAVRGSGPSRRAGKDEAEGLMPPPPVPQKQKHARLPALDVCVPSPRRSVKVEQSPEARLHPLLQQQQQKQAKGAPPLRNSSNAPAVCAAPPPPNTPMPAPATPPIPTHTETQSQSQSQPAPPRPRAAYLGMRRTHTAPSAGAAGTGGMSSSQSVRKFRPPLLNPEVALAAVAGGKTEGRVSASTNPPPAARTNPPPPARAPAPAVHAPVTPQSKPRQPQPASSPWSDTSFDEHNTSFDLEELEKVMREYDD